MSSHNSLLECPEAFVEVVEYLTYHKLYTAAEIVQQAITDEENAKMPWKKFRELYHRMRLSILENALEEPNSPMADLSFAILKHLALYHYKRKTEEYLYLLKELAYMKMFYHLKKNEIDIGTLERDFRYLLGDNLEVDSPDEDLDNPLQDLSEDEINAFKNDFSNLIEMLRKASKNSETIPFDKLNKKITSKISKLFSQHNYDHVLQRFRKFLNPIKEAFGEPFIHLVNRDIKEGYYKPKFTEIRSAPSIPDHLKNKKANPNEILNILSPENREKFKKYLEERQIRLHDEKLDDHDSVETDSHISELHQVVDEVDMEEEHNKEFYENGTNVTNEEITDEQISEVQTVEEKINVDNNVDLMMGKLRSFTTQK